VKIFIYIDSRCNIQIHGHLPCEVLPLDSGLTNVLPDSPPTPLFLGSIQWKATPRFYDKNKLLALYH
jgi:hypothetical protein